MRWSEEWEKMRNKLKLNWWIQFKFKWSSHQVERNKESRKWWRLEWNNKKGKNVSWERATRGKSEKCKLTQVWNDQSEYFINSTTSTDWSQPIFQQIVKPEFYSCRWWQTHTHTERGWKRDSDNTQFRNQIWDKTPHKLFDGMTK